MLRILKGQRRLPSRDMGRVVMSILTSGIMLLAVMVFVSPAASERVLVDLGVLMDDEGSLPWDTMDTIATHINNAGQVAGVGPTLLAESLIEGGFYWDSASGMRDIGTLGTNYGHSAVADMNGLGQIVGYSSGGHRHSGVADQAFLWDPSTNMIQGLGTFMGSSSHEWSHANSINDNGYVVGVASVDSSDREHAFLWDPSTETMDDLGAYCPSSLVEAIAGVAGNYPECAIAIDENNCIHVCYVDTGSSPIYYLKYVVGVAGSWTVETVDSCGVGTYWPSIAVDSSNMPHIAYCDPTNMDLKHAYKAGSSWMTETIDSTGNVGMHSSIAVGTDDKIHISYEGVLDVKYATDAPGYWASEIVSGSNDGWWTSITLDSGNKAHISYYDSDPANLDLMYATNAVTPSWSIYAIDSVGDVGRGSSIAFDDHGILHFGYIDLTNHVLKHAIRWPGGGVRTETIDCAPNPAGSTSIAIDDSNPSVSRVYIGYGSGMSADYVTDAGGPWYHEHINPGTYGTDVSLAIDSHDIVHVIYYDLVSDSFSHYQKSGAARSSADDVNSAGHVVGTFMGPDGYVHAFFWDGTAMTDIVATPAVDNRQTRVYVNDNDMVLVSQGYPAWHSYFYSESTGLSDLPGVLATDMNDLGEVVGKTWTTTGEAVHWFDGVLTILPTVYGGSSQAYDINNLGQIVGGDQYHAICWEPGLSGYTCIDIGALDQDEWLGRSCAMAINDNGQVVGTSTVSTDTADHAFLWKEDAPPVAWFELEVLSSNTEGMIVSFDASSSGDPDGTIVEYNWEFGDGTTGTGVSVIHTYVNPNGAYVINLSVTDDLGVTDTMTRQVGTIEATEQAIADLISAIDATTSTSPEVKAKLREKAMLAAQLIESRKTHGWGNEDIGSRKTHGLEGIAAILQVFDTMVGTYTTVGEIAPGEGWDLTCLSNLIIAMLGNQVMIDGVPNYLWYHGCGPTTVGMIVGYWDSMVFNDLIEGDVSTQNDAANSMMASSGYIRDYAWYPDGLERQQDGPGNLVRDASEPGQTPTHSDDCIADFMHTSRSHDGCAWGQTLNSKVVGGFAEYVDYVSPSVVVDGVVVDKYVGTAREIVGGKSLTWFDFQDQVNAKHPMAFIVDINGDHKMDHLVSVIGYCQIGCARLYAFHNTWDDTIWWANYEFMQKNVYFGIYSGFVFDIDDMSQVPP